MQRIMVLGVSPGVGKSTLARQIGEALGIETYHLDRYFWKPGWVQASEEEFAEKQREIVQRDQWVMDGNYNGTYSIRSERADTIVYLERPLSVCLNRVLKRWWTHRGQTRDDVGCTEKIEFGFLKFIVTTYYGRKKRMRERFLTFQQEDVKKEIVLLRSQQDVESFLHYLKG
ncbi:topology modulation protein [Halobacillus litoralis]|uniref:topology modulation protein n=1 Tax=Halobacillus litoralis TaxID=45668 RepID=UPI001CD603D2|nr:topology modulation protein [Halobacillus litoralis]MCA0972415.1 topology modulation protein [Halobacillus litoralis]